MKRYISSIVIVVVILLSIGTYYVKVASSASNLPKLTFKTVEGDEKELQSVVMEGYYDEGSLSEPFHVESNKVKYEKEQSYFENRFNFYDPNYERLVKEYRSFMRGKKYIETYYEDQDNLTFGTVNIDYKDRKYSSNFNIDSLEKRNKEEKSFEIDVPEQEKYEDITVRDIQFIQSKLQIITQNDVVSNDGKNTGEIHLYTIDLAGKKVVSDETILSETFDSSNQGHFAMPSKVVGKPNNVFIIALVKGSYSDEGEFKEKVGESSLFSYHYDTKKLQEIKPPKEENFTFEVAEKDYSYDEKNLYMMEWGDEKTRIWSFDLDKQKIINDYTLDSAEFTRVVDGRIFAISRGKLLIADAESGKTLYKGKLVINSDDQKKDTVQRIQFRDVYIK
ncbi:hypothetical protein ACQKL5_13415 [Peribacillus sp. NPDC097675]|uniref:hypothetical protein n=1 Tax=Peribacillus sp. NPDC097675 TaxID=3390618 RepID=UPI003CFE263E